MAFPDQHKGTVKTVDTTPFGPNNGPMQKTRHSPFTLPETALWRTPPTTAGLISAAALVALAAGIGMALRGELPVSSVPLLFLLAVLVASARFGFWTGIVASVLAFLAENFFFVEPYYTFHVGQVADWLTLLVLLVAGATTGFLVGRLREEADAARSRAHSLAVMGQFAAELPGALDKSALTTKLVGALARLNNGSALVLEPDGGGLKPGASIPDSVILSADDQEAADRAFRRKGTQAPAAAGWTGGRFTFRSIGDAIGVVGYTVEDAFRPELQHAREAIIDQAILALTNLELSREAAEAQGQAEREALRAALLSSLSHDLRTPLATILGGISSLRELGDSMPEAARQDVLQAVEEEAERLSRYVSNLLHMTRLNAGIDLRLEWIEAADCVRAAVARARRAAPSRTITIMVPDQVPLIRSDAVLLEQALFNLIDNALKFSPAETPVTVSVTVSHQAVGLSVADLGPGIPPEEQEHVFEAFFRGTNRTEGGTGLGLAITRGIVKALAGSLSLESPCQNTRGTRMLIAIPLSAGEE